MSKDVLIVDWGDGSKPQVIKKPDWSHMPNGEPPRCRTSEPDYICPIPENAHAVDPHKKKG